MIVFTNGVYQHDSIPQRYTFNSNIFLLCLNRVFVPRRPVQCLAIVILWKLSCTVYPKKYAHGLVVLCFVVVMQSFIMTSHEVFIHIHQGCFAGIGAIVRLPQCQWSKPDGYGKISQCITTTKHSKAKTVCIFLGIYCICNMCMSLSGIVGLLCYRITQINAIP